MPEYPVQFHPSAAAETERARTWYAARNRYAADAFVTEISHAVDMIGRTPDVWPAIGRCARRYVLPRFPFSVVYRIRGDSVEVVAVAHHKRKPGYWRSR